MPIKNLIRKFNTHIVSVISEDLRKIGTYVLGIGLAAIIIPNDGIEILVATLLILFGLHLWIAGILLAYLAAKFNKE